MDQTSFALLAGSLVGTHAGSAAAHTLTGWSWWLSCPVGFLLFVLATIGFIEVAGRLLDRSQPEK
jgi:hypothetical protein